MAMMKYNVVYKTQDTVIVNTFDTIFEAKEALLHYAKNFAAAYTKFPAIIREAWQRFYETDGKSFYASPDMSIEYYAHIEPFREQELNQAVELKQAA